MEGGGVSSEDIDSRLGRHRSSINRPVVNVKNSCPASPQRGLWSCQKKGIRLWKLSWKETPNDDHSWANLQRLNKRFTAEGCSKVMNLDESTFKCIRPSGTRWGGWKGSAGTRASTPSWREAAQHFDGLGLLFMLCGAWQTLFLPKTHLVIWSAESES